MSIVSSIHAADISLHTLALPLNERLIGVFVEAQVTEEHLIFFVNDATLTCHGDSSQDVVASCHDSSHLAFIESVNHTFSDIFHPVLHDE